MREALRNENSFRMGRGSCAYVTGREHAAGGRRPGPARSESICSHGQHMPQPCCQAALPSPVKPTSRRTTVALGSQVLVTVTPAGAVPCRPQAGLLQAYSASQKAGAQVPYTLKGHVI